jgi:hypothetical protein
MSVDYFFPCFVVFSLSGLFLWLAGTTIFFRDNWVESLYCAPWLGYGILVGVLQLTHLFFPLNRSVSTVVLAIVSLPASALLLAHLLRARPNRRSIVRWTMFLGLLGVIALLTFIPVFNCCTKEAFSYDLGLYYLQMIRWTETFPIVRGLVNLQPHLALNQSAFLVTSVFDSLVPNRLGIFFIGGVLPWLGLSLSLFAIVRVAVSMVRKSPVSTPIEVAYAISLPAWIFVLLGNNISSASPDSISFGLILHFFLVFSCFVVSRSDEELRWRLGEILFLGALCLCVSWNSLGLVGGALAVVVVRLFRTRERLLFLRHRRLLVMAVCSFVLLSTWMGRGVLLSGYPFFPSSALAMRVPWRMPVKQVNSFRGVMIAWARDPDPSRNIKRTLRTWRWLPGWIHRAHSSINQMVWPAQVGLAGCVVLGAAAGMERSLGRNFKILLILAVPLLFHSTLWFLTIPEPRYFGLAAWLFAISPALAFLNQGTRVGFAASVANLCLNALPMFYLLWDFRSSWTKPEARLPQLKLVDMMAVSNSHGVQIWIPVNGNQSFDSPLPSGQGPAPELALLDPQKGIAGGFRFLKPASPQ